MTATAATALLDSLAEALAEEGFASAPHYADSPAALHVWDPARPDRPGESITILVGDLDLPWYWAATRRQVLAACGDLRQAVTAVVTLLRPPPVRQPPPRPARRPPALLALLFLLLARVTGIPLGLQAPAARRVPAFREPQPGNQVRDAVWWQAHPPGR